MNAERLPHRQASSRQTRLTDTHAAHTVEDGEYKQKITPTTDAADILEFLQKLVSWYESDVDSQEELFLHAEVDDDGQIYIRDQQGGEWLCWSVSEWTAIKPDATSNRLRGAAENLIDQPELGIREGTVRAIIHAITWTYEEPSTIKELADRVQVEICAP